VRRKLSEEENRRRYSEARDLWNEFDPIGVFQIDNEWPKDEYDGYVGPTLRLIIEGKGIVEVENYVRSVVHDRIGLSETKQGSEAVGNFARKFTDWYRDRWPDTEIEPEELKGK
jgi:hypothetical protein